MTGFQSRAIGPSAPAGARPMAQNGMSAAAPVAPPYGTYRVGRPRGRAIPAALAGPLGFDLLLLALVGMLEAAVWRLTDFYPVLAAVHPAMLAEGAILVLFVMDRDPRRKFRPLESRITRIALALGALMCLSTPFSLWPGYSATFVALDYLPSIYMMLMIAAAVRVVEDVERLILVQVIGGAAFSAIVITRFHVDSTGRLSNLAYYDANDFAMLCVCTLPLAIYFIRKPGSTVVRIFAGLAVGLAMIGIVRSGSRGGFIGLVAVTVTLLITFRAVPARVRVGTVVGIFVLLSLVASDQYWDFVKTLTHPKDDYNWAGNSSTGRVEVWKRGIGYMMSNPFLGVGPQVFPKAEGVLSPAGIQAQLDGTGKVPWMAAHNSYVQIGAELGIFGLIGYLMLLGTSWRMLARLGRIPDNASGVPNPSPALAQVLLASLVGFIFCAFFLSQAYAGFLYSMLGIILGLAKVNNVDHVSKKVRRVLRGGGQPAAFRGAPPQPNGARPAQ